MSLDEPAAHTGAATDIIIGLNALRHFFSFLLWCLFIFPNQFLCCHFESFNKVWSSVETTNAFNYAVKCFDCWLLNHNALGAFLFLLVIPVFEVF